MEDGPAPLSSVDELREGGGRDDAAGAAPPSREGDGTDTAVDDGATQRERVEGGLQDTLDLTDWRMPSARDYLWYLLVYGVLIALAVYIVLRWRDARVLVIWGGYLAAMLVLAFLVVRSMNYRRGTYSKSFRLSTLELQRAVEGAIEEVGLRVERFEEPPGAFLRPLIGVYRLDRRDYTVVVEGKSHIERKVVRVGRFGSRELQLEGERLCLTLDAAAMAVREGRVVRSLFK